MSHKNREVADKVGTLAGSASAVGSLCLAIVGESHASAGDHLRAGLEYAAAGTLLVGALALQRAHMAFKRTEAMSRVLDTLRAHRPVTLDAPFTVNGVEHFPMATQPQPTGLDRLTIEPMPRPHHQQW